jgi:hypothetical protein
MADGKHKYTLLQFQERLIDIIENVFGKDLDAKDTSQNKGWGLLGPGGAAGPFGKRVRNKAEVCSDHPSKKKGSARRDCT